MLVSELVLVIDNRCLVITIDKKSFSTEKKRSKKKKHTCVVLRRVASRAPCSLPGTPVISLPVPHTCRCQCCEPEGVVSLREPVVVIIKVLTMFFHISITPILSLIRNRISLINIQLCLYFWLSIAAYTIC